MDKILITEQLDVPSQRQQLANLEAKYHQLTKECKELSKKNEAIKNHTFRKECQKETVAAIFKLEEEKQIDQMKVLEIEIRKIRNKFKKLEEVFELEKDAMKQEFSSVKSGMLNTLEDVQARFDEMNPLYKRRIAIQQENAKLRELLAREEESRIQEINTQKRRYDSKSIRKRIRALEKKQIHRLKELQQVTVQHVGAKSHHAKKKRQYLQKQLSVSQINSMDLLKQNEAHEQENKRLAREHVYHEKTNKTLKNLNLKYTKQLQKLTQKMEEIQSNMENSKYKRLTRIYNENYNETKFLKNEIQDLRQQVDVITQENANLCSFMDQFKANDVHSLSKLLRDTSRDIKTKLGSWNIENEGQRMDSLSVCQREKVFRCILGKIHDSQKESEQQEVIKNVIPTIPSSHNLKHTLQTQTLEIRTPHAYSLRRIMSY